MRAFEADGPVMRPARWPSSRGAARGALAALVFTSVTAALIGAADFPRSFMSREDYAIARRTIESETRLALAACRSQQGRAKEVCRAEARGEERIRRAELEALYAGTVAAEARVEQARLKTHYEIARARCTDLFAGERSACLHHAREERSRALAEARPSSS
jgi:hypothetical protein